MSKTGSEMKWGAQDSRTCTRCDKPVRLSDTFDARQLYDPEGHWIAAVTLCGRCMTGAA